jgi:hypothetical protein
MTLVSFKILDKLLSNNHTFYRKVGNCEWRGINPAMIWSMTILELYLMIDKDELFYDPSER